MRVDFTKMHGLGNDFIVLNLPADACLPLSPQPATSADAATLAGQYAAWHTWFGPWTGQWWALPKQASGTFTARSIHAARKLSQAFGYDG